MRQFSEATRVYLQISADNPWFWAKGWEREGSPHSALICMRAQLLSDVWLFVTPWTVAHQGSSVHGIFQATIVEWVAVSFSRGIFPTRWLNPSLLLGRWILHHWATRETLKCPQENGNANGPCSLSWEPTVGYQLVCIRQILIKVGPHGNARSGRDRLKASLQ